MISWYIRLKNEFIFHRAKNLLSYILEQFLFKWIWQQLILNVFFKIIQLVSL